MKKTAVKFVAIVFVATTLIGGVLLHRKDNSVAVIDPPTPRIFFSLIDPPTP